LSASNVFEVQDEITEEVVATIAGVSGVISRARFSESKANPTESLEAYECVLQAVAYYGGSLAASEHARVRASLERAVKSDPDYSDAWAWLSVTYLDEDRFNYNPRPNPLNRALDAAQKAVALDPTSQAASNALALVHFQRQELDAFLPEAERALTLNPNHAWTLGSLGTRFHWAGDERGIALIEKAMRLDPFLPGIFNYPIASYHFERGEYQEALAAARKVNLPGFFPTQAQLAAIYAELGRDREARSAVEELLRLQPGHTIEKTVEDMRKQNRPEDTTRRFVAALRKAGLPE
jgi:tetratricopeptide (TPR) repeat protein